MRGQAVNLTVVRTDAKRYRVTPIFYQAYNRGLCKLYTKRELSIALALYIHVFSSIDSSE